MIEEKLYSVYIMASKRNGTLYVGFSGDLLKRVWEHKNDMREGFTKKYGVHTLVYFEMFSDPDHAIGREKQLKGWNRAWKIKLIERMNPSWKDLYRQLIESAGFSFDESENAGPAT